MLFTGYLCVFPTGAQVVVIMVTNQDQAQSVLYGHRGAVSGMFLLKLIIFHLSTNIFTNRVLDFRDEN